MARETITVLGNSNEIAVTKTLNNKALITASFINFIYSHLKILYATA
jgi:hypothetical protein